MDLTPKQEAFCLAYIETGNASEAYRLAGYSAGNVKTTHEAASRLLKNSKVLARVEAIQRKHVERHLITVDDLVRELDEARKLAIETEAPAAAVAATMGKGKLLGLIVDRNQVGGDPNNPVRTHTVIEQVIIDPAKS